MYISEALFIISSCVNWHYNKPIQGPSDEAYSTSNNLTPEFHWQPTATTHQKSQANQEPRLHLESILSVMESILARHVDTYLRQPSIVHARLAIKPHPLVNNYRGSCKKENAKRIRALWELK
jgi:hypothetical protein